MRSGIDCRGGHLALSTERCRPNPSRPRASSLWSIDHPTARGLCRDFSCRGTRNKGTKHQDKCIDVDGRPWFRILPSPGCSRVTPDACFTQKLRFRGLRIRAHVRPARIRADRIIHGVEVARSKRCEHPLDGLDPVVCRHEHSSNGSSVCHTLRVGARAVALLACAAGAVCQILGYC